MQTAKRDRYREKLQRMRERLVSEAQYVADAIQQEANPAGNLSSVPVHLADTAVEALDADVQVLATERILIDDVVAALARLDEGTYGVCQQCEGKISEARLDAVPYTALCIDCARANEANVANDSAS